ncbi:MAG: chorismate lyase [Betaproteobacteria bacterium]|nr:chorismate lyase [Betaproteobacteria bacterium]
MRTLKLTRLDAWRGKPPVPTHALYPWLTDRGSLSARLAEAFEAFGVQRLSQSRRTPHRDERRHVGARNGEQCIVREVLLLCDVQPRVFAHSVALPRDLTGVWRGLSKLGARPLADMLFGDTSVARHPIEYKQIDRRHALFRAARRALPNLAATRLWARRSVFMKRGRPLLVTEVFLEPMVRGAHPTRHENL